MPADSPEAAAQPVRPRHGLRAHEHCVRVIYRDTDQMGVVYYGNYFAFMESGRAEFMRALGWTYREMEQAGFILPVVHADCRYLRPARYDDLLRVHTALAEVTRASLRFEYQIFCDARQEMLAHGSTQHPFVSREGRPRRAPQELVDFLLGKREQPPQAGG